MIFSLCKTKARIDVLHAGHSRVHNVLSGVAARVRPEAPEGEQRMGGWPNRGGESAGVLPRVAYSVVSSAPHSGRTAHRVASRPPGRPLRRSVSSPSPKRAPRRRIPALHTGGQKAHARARACSHCDRSVSPRHRRSPRGGGLLAAQRHSDDAARVHLEVDSRGRCAAVAGHGLVIQHELARLAASGRIGRC